MGNCTSSPKTNSSLYTVNDIQEYQDTTTTSSSSSTTNKSNQSLAHINYTPIGGINDICTGWNSTNEFLTVESTDNEPVINLFSIQQNHHHHDNEYNIVRKYTGHQRSITRISLSPSSNISSDTPSIDYTRLLATGSRDLSINIYNYEQNKPLTTLTGHEFSISALSFAPGNKRLASGSRDTSVRIWDTSTSICISKLAIPQNIVTCMKWYPNTSLINNQNEDNTSILIQGGEDLRVRIWDTRSKLQCLKIIDGYVYFPVSIES